MYKKTITYIDYEGQERTEDFYFHLNKAELIEMELSFEGGLSKTVEEVSKTKNRAEIVRIFKQLICKSYGKKSMDGKRFMKSDDITREFTETEAYSQLFMELGTDAEAAAAFVNGVIPKIDEADLAKIQALNP